MVLGKMAGNLKVIAFICCKYEVVVPVSLDILAMVTASYAHCSRSFEV